VMKEIGDGSFGSVALARVRTAGAHIARRGTLVCVTLHQRVVHIRLTRSQVAIKTMKKTFDSFSSCLELREVIFLRSLPPHPHLVPALDIFLDPYSRRLHIAMEYMDGNLYQLMKARDHKPLDTHSVKSILFQILAGLEHIHAREFFHRDIKPENILVSTSQHNDTSHPFRRYSAMMTPPSTPPVYTIKIADFGLARETHSKLPYTTYVSTRWYRAPEVLLRAGEYSAPVDIWAVGAMAVEIATLKPLFPGGNEVDQVWRVCEIMGSPGGWVNKHGQPVGGGEWKEGVRLAQKLGFSFPKVISFLGPLPAALLTQVLRWRPTPWTPSSRRRSGLPVWPSSSHGACCGIPAAGRHPPRPWHTSSSRTRLTLCASNRRRLDCWAASSLIFPQRTRQMAPPASLPRLPRGFVALWSPGKAPQLSRRTLRYSRSRRIPRLHHPTPAMPLRLPRAVPTLPNELPGLTVSPPKVHLSRSCRQSSPSLPCTRR
jgi:serine/threonine protein kinase